MTYIPKTEETLAKEGLLPEGIYDFEVIETSDQPSKKGNDMFTLKLYVFDNDGSQRFIFDYIALGNNFGERKLRHAADACGLMDTYNSGKLTDRDFLNKCGKILLKQQNGTADFPMPKNIVSDYLSRDDSGGAAHDAPAKPIKPAGEIINDDIPF